MYTYSWKKYLPLIGILLKRAPGNAQSVQLNRMDFDKTRKKNPSSIAFSIDLQAGRIRNVSPAEIAKQLLEIVAGDDVSSKLLQKNNYKIDFTNSCELRIENVEKIVAQ